MNLFGVININRSRIIVVVFVIIIKLIERKSIIGF